jgi:RIO kinase 2
MLLTWLDDGYRLTYGGLDYLALHTHTLSSTLFSLGNQIGVGKESDIYVSASPTNRQLVLKLHRLGRISFRTVKANRDYLRNRTTGSWMYLSRLAAQKEYAFMKVLHREGFAVPEPVGWSRHTVVMSFIDALPLRMIESVPHPARLYGELMDIVVKLAQRGLIHGDFNEFNILVKENTSANGDIQLQPILIDFPQMTSTDHTDAEMYFKRDVECVKSFFERRFKFIADDGGPVFEEVMKGLSPERRLDVEVEASGFSRKMARELERAVGRDVDGQNGMQDQGEAENEVEDEEDDELFEDPEMDELKVSEELRGLSLSDDLAVKPTGGMDFGLTPLEIPREVDVVAEKVHNRKRATGWAI